MLTLILIRPCAETARAALTLTGGQASSGGLDQVLGEETLPIAYGAYRL
ncbi:hypothetical protein [Falsiroseomonas sp. HW251]